MLVFEYKALIRHIAMKTTYKRTHIAMNIGKQENTHSDTHLTHDRVCSDFVVRYNVGKHSPDCFGVKAGRGV